MAFKLQPLQNFVIVKPGGSEGVSKGGIVIPDTAQEKSQEGTIIAVGPGRIVKDGKHEKMGVSVGDVVLYPKFANTAEYKVEGEIYLFIPEPQIIAIVKG